MTTNKYFILTTQSKLPKEITKEIYNKGTKKNPITNYIIYNDLNDTLKLSSDDNFINKLNNDKTQFTALYKDYFNTQDIKQIKESLDDEMKEYKKAKIDNPEITLEEINSELNDVITKSEAIKNTYPKEFQHYFKIDDKQVKKQPEKVLSKINDFKQYIQQYQNTDYILIINTLSKDFKQFEPQIKDIVNYGLTYKKLWLICDLTMYKLIGVEGIELRTVSRGSKGTNHKAYLIKFN